MTGRCLSSLFRAPSKSLFPLAAVLAAVLLLAAPSPVRAANPSLSDDFKSMMDWMSQELAQGIAFNAGSTFDPPMEVHGGKLLPDISLGAGTVPLDKSKFPVIQAQALRDMNAANIFPAKVLIPNLAVHLRAGLPARFDIAVRGANMTTPSNYEINPGTIGKGQSNSIGFGVRRHFFGGEDPQLTLGANYNHVLGGFTFGTKFNVDNISGFSAESQVRGDLDWNVNSYGLTAVISKTYGKFIPFIGSGYNYATGSVHARLSVASNTPLISPIQGSSSRKPEPDSARFILGTQWNAKWVSLFSNGEIKVLGDHSGESWIVQFGVVMPFRIGWSRKTAKARAKSRSAREETVEDGVEEPTGSYNPLPARKTQPAKKQEPAKKGKSKPKPAQPAESDSDFFYIQ
ncbi:MAG: hypothetical protein HZB91_07000 [Elusimicrobia bacterium]|nr:hypothetical protein [Elusimicrobiota bacterium]